MGHRHTHDVAKCHVKTPRSALRPHWFIRTHTRSHVLGDPKIYKLVRSRFGSSGALVQSQAWSPTGVSGSLGDGWLQFRATVPWARLRASHAVPVVTSSCNNQWRVILCVECNAQQTYLKRFYDRSSDICSTWHT